MATSTVKLEAHDLQPVEATRNKEDVRLISLDTRIDDATKSSSTRALILEMSPAALFYTDVTRCITFVKSVRDENVIIIIWDGRADDLLSEIHNSPSLTAVFIYSEKCSNLHAKLLTTYSKIMGVFTDQHALLESIRGSTKVLERMVVAFSLFDQKQKSIRDLSKNSASFLWYQLLIKALKNMPQDEQAKNDMLEMCENFYASKNDELLKIAEFRKSYTQEKAIWWYSDECFLYKLLNRGIRTEDIDLLYSFRFFIIDLSTALENECKKLKDQGTLTLYREQLIPDEEFQQLRASVGLLISINGFLSTSRNKDVALRFARMSATTQRNCQVCLIKICADPSLKSVVVADIEQYSKMQGEQEVLFGLGATFKVESIEMDTTQGMWLIKLITTDEGAERTQEYMRAQNEMMKDYSPMVCFGRLLWNELGQIDRAEKYYKNLLKSLPPDHADIADIYNGIGSVYSKKGEFGLALKTYKQAYEIRQRTLQKTHPKIAGSLHNIGVIYKAQGQIDRALNSYYQALTIHEANYPGDHEDKGYTIESIGLAYKSKEELDTALIWLNRALEMYKRIFPAMHPERAKCLGSIGSVYEVQGELDRALDYYHRQLEMEEKCLPPDHLKLTKHLDWIVRIHIRKNEQEKALTLCQEKLAAQRNILSENHPDIAFRVMKIGDLLNSQTEYYQQALDILKKCTPSNRLLEIKCLDMLGTDALNRGDFQLALTHQLHILDICRRIYEPSHPLIASRLQKIGDIYLENVQNCEQAVHYYSECLAIYKVNYSPLRKDVVDIQEKIYKIQVKLTGKDVRIKKDDTDDKDFSLFD